MPAIITSNEKPTAATDRGGLDFVWTTTRLHSGKDNRYDLLHDHAAPRKPN